MYERLLPTLAELDKSLFEVVRKTYEAIIELNHYRQILTDFLAGENLAPYRDMTKHFLNDLADEKDDYYKILSEGYKALTGKDLESWKLR